MDVEIRACGIPCIARVTRYYRQRPLGPSADSDWDCYGYHELDYDILDRGGRRAAWLERKVDADSAARDQIEEQILEVIGED